MRSPGRMRRIAPGPMLSIGTSVSVPSRLTRAVFGWRRRSPAMAAPACPRARASISRPSRISTTITAAASK